MNIQRLDRTAIHPRLPAGATRAALTAYGPERADWGVVVLPGGGYGLTAADREGHPVAAAFAEAGYAAAVLEYSVAPDRWPLPLLEAAAAVAFLRRRGAARVAVCGFSAGGHLAGCAANLWDAPEVRETLDLPEGAARPDAAVLCYPVITAKPPFGSVVSYQNLLGEGAPVPAALCLENAIGPQTPPTFLWATVADATVPVEHSLLCAAALRQAHVPFELHLYPSGPHAMALADARSQGRPDQQDPHVATWFPLCLEWLKGL